ncbi:hypothetical protein Tco_0545802 [Tanacetum coccineum]
MTESTVPQLVSNKGGSYSAIDSRLEVGKFNKWKKCMLCYLNGMEPNYIQCIKDGPFQPKTAEGANKPKAQWSNDERRAINQDQLKKHGLTWRFVYEDNLISRRYPESKKALTTTPSTSPISIAFFLIILFMIFKKILMKRLMRELDEEEMSNDEEMTQVKVLMALADDELVVRKNHARNGERIDITMRKSNILLSIDEDVDWKT